MKAKEFFAGWHQVDITPQKPVLLCGQFHARISEGIKDPITSTIAFFQATSQDKKEYAVLISCDLVVIPQELRDAIIEKVSKIMPDIDEQHIIINATHTHTAPEPGGDIFRSTKGKTTKEIYGIELPAMDISEYTDFASTKIANGIKTAREKMVKSGIGFGCGFAVVGFNRRIAYYDGSSRMYGKTNDEQFSHVEGYEDHSLNVFGTWDKNKNLTGLIINLSCPSQVDEHLFLISADYWHEVRQEIKRRLGENIIVLGQCAAAGDQSPHILLCQQTYQRMWNLSGRTERQDIAIRIADGLCRVLPDIEKDIRYEFEFGIVKKTIELTRYKPDEKEIKEASVEAERYWQEYERLKKEIEESPEKKQKPRWYVDITRNYRRYRWYSGYLQRCEQIKENPKAPVNIYALRISDAVFATNPFECYLDYGIRIKARSPATQTFIVQLAGPGTYLPTQRATTGKSYGAIGPSCVVGPEGGKELVEQTLQIIKELWEEKC